MHSDPKSLRPLVQVMPSVMPEKYDLMMNKSEIARTQCERTARGYYTFRMKGGTANDLVEIPAMKKLIGNVSGKKVIDCGCGFGTYSIYCAKLGALVTALDISDTMIQIAKQKAAEAAVQIDFRVQDVTNKGEPHVSIHLSS